MSDSEETAPKMTPLARNALGILVVSCVPSRRLSLSFTGMPISKPRDVRCFLLFTGSPHF